MAPPRYRPRDFCVPPELFGKVPLNRSRWHPVSIPGVERFPPAVREQLEAEQKVLMDASRVQHAYAVTIRERMKGQGLTLSDYAKLTGRDSGKRIGAYLRGEVVMRFDDLSWAQRLLGNVRQTVHSSLDADRPRPLR